MKNFAIWYEGSEETDLDVHFNLWKLSKNKRIFLFKETEFARVLDIGLMISNAENVGTINIFIPSENIKKEEIIDLSDTVFSDSEGKLLNAIFNEHLTITAEQHINYKKVKNKLKQEKDFQFCKLQENLIELTKSGGGQILKITLPDTVKDDKKEGRTYLRIRLNSSQIFQPLDLSEPKNSFIQAAFSKYETIDFRFNESRGLPSEIYNKIGEQKKFNIKKVHFLFICNSSEDFMLSHLPYGSCRRLEDEVWDKYLEDISSINKSLITYHWKEDKSKKDEKIESFNALVKTKFTHTNTKTFLIYLGFILLITVGFNLLSSLLYDSFKPSPPNYYEIDLNKKQDTTRTSYEVRIIRDSLAD